MNLLIKKKMNSQKKLTNNLNKNSEFINFSTNSQINRSNKTFAYNLKKLIFTKNIKFNKQKPITYISNKNSTNISYKNSINKNSKISKEYKTAINSPNKIYKGDNPKNLKQIIRKKDNKNIISNNSKTHKIHSIISITNSSINNKNKNNKIIIKRKKSKEKVWIQDIFALKLNRKKIKKYYTTKNSNNNSINLNNISNKNIQINSSENVIPRLKYNNFNNENKIQKIKEQLIDSLDDNDNNFKNGNINNTNFKSNSIIIKYIKPYMEKDFRKNIDLISDKNMKEKRVNNYGQTSKDFYDIKRYISSAFSNHPKRKKTPRYSKKKFNTINNKVIFFKFENEKNCLSSKKKIKNNKNEIELNQKKMPKNYLKRDEYTIFVKSNLQYKNLIKTANITKYQSRKELNEKNINLNKNKKTNKQLKVKTAQTKPGQPIRLSSENNINLNPKITNKSVSTNNYSNQNSEFITKSNYLNKKNDLDYNFMYNNFFLKNNKKGFKNDLKNTKKKIYSAQNSKEKLNKKIHLHKKNYLDKLFKNIKKSNLNFRTHNSSKEEIIIKKNLSYKFNTPRNNINKRKINVHKKAILEIKKIEKKIKSPFQQNKENSSNQKKIDYKKSDKYSGSKSKIEINNKNSFFKNIEIIKEKIKKPKLEEINEENNNNINEEKSKKSNNILKNKDYENRKKKENNKSKEKKKIPDKDLSDIDEDISLLNYLINNIDNNPPSNTDSIILNDSYNSSHSPLKENNKYLIYNKTKEIISNYLKQYYLKHNKYPKTKMHFYKYGRLLGKGAYGKVNLCLHALTGRLVAIKSINKSKITKERQRQKIKLETLIMKTLSESNNIVKIYETYETKKHICIVMEYICAGDLLSYIKKRSKLTEIVSKFIFKQIILALQYIHNHNIVHRDIKLDNILIDLDNNVKICDFGVSKIIKKGDIMLDQCGTPAYIAPEILKDKGYEGFGVDIWSAGVVLYAMLSGTVPFKGEDLKELHKIIIDGEFKSIKNISKEANHLLKCLLEVDPKKRIKSQDILNHPWMINVDLNLFMTKNLFTKAENILLAKSNVDYTDINYKENMVENFNIKNLDTEEKNENINILTKSIILAPFNSSISFEKTTKNLKTKDILDSSNPDLIVRNGIIKFNPKAKDLNRNYELNNNKEIDNGIIIISHDCEEKEIKVKSPIDSDKNSKLNSRRFSPIGEKEGNNINRITIIRKNNILNEKILEKMKNLGYEKEYIKYCINNKEFNYATATYKLLDKFMGK